MSSHFIEFVYRSSLRADLKRSFTDFPDNKTHVVLIDPSDIVVFFNAKFSSPKTFGANETVYYLEPKWKPQQV